MALLQLPAASKCRPQATAAGPVPTHPPTHPPDSATSPAFSRAASPASPARRRTCAGVGKCRSGAAGIMPSDAVHAQPSSWHAASPPRTRTSAAASLARSAAAPACSLAPCAAPAARSLAAPAVSAAASRASPAVSQATPPAALAICQEVREGDGQRGRNCEKGGRAGSWRRGRRRRLLLTQHRLHSPSRASWSSQRRQRRQPAGRQAATRPRGAPCRSLAPPRRPPARSRPPWRVPPRRARAPPGGGRGMGRGAVGGVKGVGSSRRRLARCLDPARQHCGRHGCSTSCHARVRGAPRRAQPP